MIKYIKIKFYLLLYMDVKVSHSKRGTQIEGMSTSCHKRYLNL